MSKQCSQAQRQARRQSVTPGASSSLQVILWGVWTIAVLGRAYVYVRSALHAQAPFNLAGLVIHCTLAGLIGMVVLTLMEQRLEPWRFIDEQDF